MSEQTQQNDGCGCKLKDIDRVTIAAPLRREKSSTKRSPLDNSLCGVWCDHTYDSGRFLLPVNRKPSGGSIVTASGQTVKGKNEITSEFQLSGRTIPVK